MYFANKKECKGSGEISKAKYIKGLGGINTAKNIKYLDEISIAKKYQSFGWGQDCIFVKITLLLLVIYK